MRNSMKMLKFCKWSLFFVLTIIIESSTLNYNKKEVRCDVLCTNVHIFTRRTYGKWPCCERGCRMFNIILLTYGCTINRAKKECYSACEEAYNEEEFKECTLGCDTVSDEMIKDIEKEYVPFFLRSYYHKTHLHDYNHQEDNNMNLAKTSSKWPQHSVAGIALFVFHIFMFILCIFFILRTHIHINLCQQEDDSITDDTAEKPVDLLNKHIDFCEVVISDYGEDKIEHLETSRGI